MVSTDEAYGDTDVRVEQLSTGPLRETIQVVRVDIVGRVSGREDLECVWRRTVDELDSGAPLAS